MKHFEEEHKIRRFYPLRGILFSYVEKDFLSYKVGFLRGGKICMSSPLAIQKSAFLYYFKYGYCMYRGG